MEHPAGVGLPHYEDTAAGDAFFVIAMCQSRPYTVKFIDDKTDSSFSVDMECSASMYAVHGALMSDQMHHYDNPASKITLRVGLFKEEI